MGDECGDPASGGNISGVERKNGVAGRGLCQLRPKRVTFLVDDGAAEMIRCRGLCAPKQQSHCRASGTGAIECKEWCRGNTDG